MEQTTNRFDMLVDRLKHLAAAAPAPPELDEPEGRPDSAPEIERARRLNVPPRFARAKLTDFEVGDFKNPENYRQLRELDSLPDNLLIVGDNASGKSHLAAAIAKTWGFRWRSVTLLLTEIRSSFNAHNEVSEYGIVKGLSDVPRLVLDDLSACALNTFSLVTIVAVLNARIEYMRPTIVTSAIGLQTLDKVDSNLSSRLSSYSRLILKPNDRRFDRDGAVREWQSHTERTNEWEDQHRS